MAVIVKTDKAKWINAINHARDLAAAALAEQMLNDSMQYIPRLNGELRSAGRVEKGESGKMYLVWDTVYALYQWFGVRADGSHRVNNYTTPGTGTKWVDKAKETYGKSWETIAQKEFKGGLE